MEEEELAERFGTAVRRLRLHRGYSQAGFAEVCKIERAYMGMIERGEVNVSVRTALKITRGLNLTLTDFFSEVEGPPSSEEDLG